ncbi:MAG TPA: hypothetical protein VG897_19045 [Terriglobales bacterium]|nr:hypothetical protein [Terriglobales bacterium]
MNRIAILFITLLLAAGLCIAQTDNSSNPSNSNGQSQATSTTNNSNTATQDNTQTNPNAGENSAAPGNNGNLPQTATPMPVIGMLGLAWFGLGAIALSTARRKKGKQDV